MRRRQSLPLVLLVFVFAACGSSSSSDDPAPTRRPAATRTPGGPTRTPRPTNTPGGPTNTPRPTRTPGPPETLYVRQTVGDDMNAGTAPDQALRSIGAAVRRLNPGSTIYVGRGVYEERLTLTDIAGTAELPVRIIADREGAHTGDPDGDVVLDAADNAVAIILTRATWVTIDGFIVGGTAPPEGGGVPVSIRLRGGSDHSAVHNCIIANAALADGIRIDSSSDVTVFNNLVFGPDRGIVVTGDAHGTQIVNNTVVLSARAGISLRANGGVAPTDTRVVNTIVQEAGARAAVDAAGASDGYDGHHNLVFQPFEEDQAVAYAPPEIRSEEDRNVDALFINVGVGDVRLEPDSPAIDAGTGDIDPALRAELLARSTSPDNAPDRPPVDMGFHYPR